MSFFQSLWWVYIPVSSRIQFCNNKIFDRNGDADQDVSTPADLMANISNRKSSTYSERKMFPYAVEDDLFMELIGKTRQMAVNKNKNHVWKNMTDMELLRSAGLYEKNLVTGQKVFKMTCFF